MYIITLTNVAQVRLTRDNQERVDCSAAELQAMSNLFAELEVAYAFGVKTSMQNSGAMTEALSDDVRLTITAGAGGVANPVCVPVSLDFTPDALTRSSAMVAAKANTILTRKEATGKARPVTVARMLSQR